MTVPQGSRPREAVDRAMGHPEGRGHQAERSSQHDQEKLAKLAQSEPKWVLMTLAHHIDEVWLREA